MSIKKYSGGSWQDVGSIKRYASGTWQDVNEVKAYKNGAWESVFPDEILIRYHSLDVSDYCVEIQFRQVSEKELEISFHANTESELLFYFDCSQMITDVEFIFESTSGYSPDDDFYVLFFRNAKKVLEKCIEAGKEYVSVNGFAEQIAVCVTSNINQISQLDNREHAFYIPTDVEWTFRIRSTKNRLRWK